jgi:hypothetical protein
MTCVMSTGPLAASLARCSASICRTAIGLRLGRRFWGFGPSGRGVQGGGKGGGGGGRREGGKGERGRREEGEEEQEKCHHQ